MVTEVSGEADFRQQIGVKGKLVVVSPTCSPGNFAGVLS